MKDFISNYLYLSIGIAIAIYTAVMGALKAFGVVGMSMLAIFAPMIVYVAAPIAVMCAIIIIYLVCDTIEEIKDRSKR